MMMMVLFAVFDGGRCRCVVFGLVGQATRAAGLKLTVVMSEEPTLFR